MKIVFFLLFLSITSVANSGNYYRVDPYKDGIWPKACHEATSPHSQNNVDHNRVVKNLNGSIVLALV